MSEASKPLLLQVCEKHGRVRMGLHFLRKLLFVVVSACASSNLFADVASQQPDDSRIVSESELVISGDLVDVYKHRIDVDTALLVVLESAYRRLQQLLGHPHDRKALGNKLRVYISPAARFSHVWRGYDHKLDPRGILFLSESAYRGALKGVNATYVHEMVHLFEWRFNSHTLREGLADYLALQLIPGAGVGPNVEGHRTDVPIPDEILEYLGTTKKPPGWLTTDLGKRRAYYSASYRFVAYIVAKFGLEKFMILYYSESPESVFAEVFGVSRKSILNAVRQPSLSEN